MIAKYIFFLILIMVTIPVNAHDDIMINLNMGNLGFGTNIPLNDEYSTETTITLLNIGIEHKKTNIGMEFTPLKTFSWKNTAEDSDDSMEGGYSLANLKLYWNILNLEYIYIGPFTSIDYFFIENSIIWNRYVFTGGVHVGFRIFTDIINYNIFSIEIGYRNIDGKSKYFIGAKIDIPVFFVSVLYLAANSSNEDKK